MHTIVLAPHMHVIPVWPLHVNCFECELLIFHMCLISVFNVPYWKWRFWCEQIAAAIVQINREMGEKGKKKDDDNVDSAHGFGNIEHGINVVERNRKQMSHSLFDALIPKTTTPCRQLILHTHNSSIKWVHFCMK